MQNLRGRFKSEGVFLLTSRYDANDPKQTNETNDAYDTINWLVKNVPNNNGRVGIYGVSYNGLTAGLTLLHPNPALKAISEQAAPVDQWMNDDMHRYGALRESYAFEYSVMEQSDKNTNKHFDFDTYDTYQWYLNLGPLTNANANYLHGSIPYWNDIMAHPNYDDFWQKEAWVNQLHSSTVPNLNVAGFWDQEDPWGPWQIFRHAEQHDPDHTNYMVAGPWYHGEWQTPDGDRIGIVPFGGHKTALEFRQQHPGRLLPLLPPQPRHQARLASHHLPDRIQHLAQLRRLASSQREADQSLSPLRRNFILRSRCRSRQPAISPVRFRSRESRALSRAPHLAHLS